MPAARIACLWVPMFPLAARLRAEPELGGGRLAVTAGENGGARIVAASRRARKEGVAAGMTVAQARARLPEIVLRRADPLCERSAQEALIEAAERFSPRVEEAGPGRVFLDADGLSRLFADERELAREMIAAARRAGLPARAGVAGSKLAARAAAELPDSPVVVPPGRDAAFLAALPLSSLEPPPEMAEPLRRWGMRRVGDLAALPEAEVARRLGEEGRALHRAARGSEISPLCPRAATPDFREGMELEWTVDSLEPFLFVVKGALERLCARLGEAALACAEITLRLRLESGGEETRRIPLPAPSLDSRALLCLLRLWLERHPPGSPVTGFEVSASPGQVRPLQASLFGPAAMAPARLAAALSEIEAIVGPDRAGSPEPADSHLPGKFRLARFAPPPAPAAQRSAAPRGARVALRLVRPPEEAELPARLLSGPWRIEESAWSESGAERDYWDAELADGRLARLFRDRRSGRWYLDGVYD